MVDCPICRHANIQVIYQGPLRKGTFGDNTSQDYSVYSCTHCHVKFIQDIMPLDYYQSTEYREDYNNTVEVNNFYYEYDINDTHKVAKIGLQNLRNKKIADFGTAAGTFLQVVKNISDYTIAIEPSKHFHGVLLEHNKHVFSYGDELVASNIKINIATSFDVIEHVTSPEKYLNDIYNSLEVGGKLFLKTPNFNDILHELIPDYYDAFNYRTAHLFYFCTKSMQYLLDLIGFKNYTINYMHDYDISNLLFWMKDAKPTGLGKTDLFDEYFNLVYKSYLEQNAKASHLWVEAVK